MNSLNQNQENPLDLKEEILGVFKIVGDILKKANFREALSVFSGHFHVHLDKSFQANRSNPENAPAYFVDSIVSEYFLFRPFPENPQHAGFIKTENSRYLQVTAALILQELSKHQQIDLSKSQSLSNPQVLEELRETLEWFNK